MAKSIQSLPQTSLKGDISSYPFVRGYWAAINTTAQSAPTSPALAIKARLLPLLPGDGYPEDFLIRLGWDAACREMRELAAHARKLGLSLCPACQGTGGAADDGDAPCPTCEGVGLIEESPAPACAVCGAPATHRMTFDELPDEIEAEYYCSIHIDEQAARARDHGMGRVTARRMALCPQGDAHGGQT
ncbi:MAG: hypothetical protein JXB47_12785 [Anaerolineae bacterium]|nr:hypothetical protein [Anaerolineae bacterium]